MQNINLRQSPVKFEALTHTYWLDGKQLKGVTSGSLIERLNPDKYAGVSQKKLDERAAYGTAIHSLIGLYEETGIISDDEDVRHYIQIKEDQQLYHVATEYLVSDEERYASSIDHVFQDKDGGIVLVDIKRTYKLDVEAVRYQLSIYRRMFEMQNPDLRVKTIAAIWLHGEEYAYVPVTPVPDDYIDYLIECDILDKPFDVASHFSTLPAIVADKEQAIADIIMHMEYEKSQLEEFRKGLYEIMEQHDIKSFCGQHIQLTRVFPTERESFDTRAFKKDYPQIYQEYVKKTSVKGNLKITLK